MKKGVICIDDFYGNKLFENQKRQGIYSFSVKSKADFYIKNIRYKNNLAGMVIETVFDFYLPKILAEKIGEKITVRTDMQGDFNICNIGVALSAVFERY